MGSLEYILHIARLLHMVPASLWDSGPATGGTVWPTGSMLRADVLYARDSHPRRVWLPGPRHWFSDLDTALLSIRNEPKTGTGTEFFEEPVPVFLK